MVAKEKAVPCFSCQFFLPFDHDLLELFEIIPFCGPLAIITAADFYMFKLEYHIQFFSVITCVFLCFLNGNS